MDGSLLFLQERAEWQEERSRLRLVAQRNVFPQIAWHLGEEVELLKSRVAKLGGEAIQVEKRDAETQTEEPEKESTTSQPAEADGLHGVLAGMLRSPEDEALQLAGIEQLFVEQTQAGAAQLESTPQLHQSLEAAVAIFVHHQSNWTLLLKASQFLSVLLAAVTLAE
ncbi:Hypothetical protein (Fragment) [Durusdinium trenchii]|uniref:Uncharacterized protein n=1 Tax=Durusdinium trenchii TaxID=1381693 RepID=A0ABP0SJN7_9DINO